MKERKPFKLSEVPEEVQYAWIVMKLNKPVGMALWTKLKEIIHRNPEWFPDEANPTEDKPEQP